jgi:hypothetical protein
MGSREYDTLKNCFESPETENRPIRLTNIRNCDDIGFYVFYTNNYFIENNGYQQIKNQYFNSSPFNVLFFMFVENKNLTKLACVSQDFKNFYDYKYGWIDCGTKDIIDYSTSSLISLDIEQIITMFTRKQNMDNLSNLKPKTLDDLIIGALREIDWNYLRILNSLFGENCLIETRLQREFYHVIRCILFSDIKDKERYFEIIPEYSLGNGKIDFALREKSTILSNHFCYNTRNKNVDIFNKISYIELFQLNNTKDNFESHLIKFISENEVVSLKNKENSKKQGNYCEPTAEQTSQTLLNEFSCIHFVIETRQRNTRDNFFYAVEKYKTLIMKPFFFFKVSLDFENNELQISKFLLESNEQNVNFFCIFKRLISAEINF